MLNRLWGAAKRCGQRIGDFLAQVMLSVFYFTVFVPFALPVRLFQDPLKQRAREQKSFWGRKEPQTSGLDDARRGF